jgi:pimeloyl-ACP methyl ester carboxylesterase
MPNAKNQVCFLTPSPLCPNKPLFIFLPGMDGTGQLLYTQKAGLQAAFDIRSLAIPVDDLSTWDELSEKVAALIETERAHRPADQPIYLCGESFGGCLALKMAADIPHLCSHIVLVNPAYSFYRQPLMRLGGEVVRWLPDFLYESSSVGLLPFLVALERILPDDRRVLLKVMKTVPQKTSAWRMALLKSFELDALPLNQMKQPVLIIASGSDRLLPSIPDAQHLSSLLPDAKLHILPESGHACLLEKDVNLYQIFQDQDFITQANKPNLIALN